MEFACDSKAGIRRKFRIHSRFCRIPHIKFCCLPANHHTTQQKHQSTGLYISFQVMSRSQVGWTRTLLQYARKHPPYSPVLRNALSPNLRRTNAVSLGNYARRWNSGIAEIRDTPQQGLSVWSGVLM
jgi:hypothetical protein